MAIPRFGDNNEENSHSSFPEPPINNFPAPPSFKSAPKEDPVVEALQQPFYNAPVATIPVVPVENEEFSYSHMEPTQEFIQEKEPIDEVYDNNNAIDMSEEFEKLDPEIQVALSALMDELTSEASTEVLMNGPNAIFNKVHGVGNLLPINFRDIDTYHHIIDTFILPQTDTHERISNTKNRVQGQLTIEDYDDMGNPLPPTLARVHIMAPPAVKWAQVTIAKKSKVSLTLSEIQQSGALTREMAEFLKLMVKGKVTTVVFGGSGGGKTTLIEALAKFFDPNDRVLVIEDTPELRVSSSPNVVYLNATKPRPGEDPSEEITLEWHVQQANRMRPSRIIVGEVLGAEMAEFLNAANSGYDGSMTTLHASSPKECLFKVGLYASRGDSSGRSEIGLNRQIAASLQILVQCEKINNRHVITSISEVSNIVDNKTGQISFHDIFAYDRMRGKHIVGSRPSDNLKDYLASSGISLPSEWFARSNY